MPNSKQSDNFELGVILRPLVSLTAAGMQMPECEHLNPHLFEASDHAIYRTKKSAK